jgi:hypothetical protein
MNGRVFDPTLGRFLSADPFVDDAGDSQSYNRYSYVSNNPLGYTDPSGYFRLKDILKIVAVVVIAIVVTIVTYGAATGVWAGVGTIASTAATSGGWALAAVAAGGFASGFAGSLLNGGSLGDAFKAGIIGAAISVASVGISAYKIDGVKIASANFSKNPGLYTLHKALHGTVGGLASEASCGKFAHGFYASAAAKVAGQALDGALNTPGISDTERYAYGLAGTTIVGGTVSEIGGGKFANGACNAAFQHMFNQWSQSFAEAMARGFGVNLSGPQMTPQQQHQVAIGRAKAQAAAPAEFADKTAGTAVYAGALAVEKAAIVGETVHYTVSTTVGIIGAGLSLMPGGTLKDVGEAAVYIKTGIDPVDQRITAFSNITQFVGYASEYGDSMMNTGFSEAYWSAHRASNYFDGKWSEQFSPFK